MGLEECDGCITRTPDVNHVKCIIVDYNDECPCVECLIKVNCDNACKPYEMFHRKYFRLAHAKLVREDRV